MPFGQEMQLGSRFGKEIWEGDSVRRYRYGYEEGHSGRKFECIPEKTIENGILVGYLRDQTGYTLGVSTRVGGKFTKLRQGIRQETW